MRTLIVLLLSIGAASAELIPAIRLMDWTPGSNVGVIGGIPNRTSLINVTQSPYNADNTGTNDAAAAIQSALNAAAANQVVYLPAGTYKCNDRLSLAANVSLRGAGMDATILMFQAGVGSPTITVGNGSTQFYTPQTGQAITAGKGKGSNTITVADASPYIVGWMIQIARFGSTNQYEDPLISGVGPTLDDNYGYPMRHKGLITSKTATTLTFFPALNNDYSGGDINAKVAMGAYQSKPGVGLEDLTINVTNNDPIFAVYFAETNNSWIKNVKIQDPANYAITFADTVNCEIRHCYITASTLAPGSNQAGILYGGNSNGLVEDNIVIDMAPGMEVNSSTGNVFAFNFFDSPATNYLNIDSNHGTHCMHNLYEGNVARHYMSDGYFGSDGYGMVFRNWFTGYATGTGGNDVTFVLALKRMSHQYTMVGNVLGFYAATWSASYDGVSLGFPNIGNGSSSGTAPPWADWGVTPGPGPGGFQELDTAVESTLIRKGNWSYYTDVQESTGGDSIPNSLFRSAKPTWFGNLTWPPVDPAAPGTATLTQIAQKIPAGYRYINGTDPPAGGGASPVAGRSKVGRGASNSRNQ